MSRASTSFDGAIEDATALLQQFDAVHKDNQNAGEVLKRAGLVMALTAWKTYSRTGSPNPSRHASRRSAAVRWANL
jgi:hypothetical protein